RGSRRGSGGGPVRRAGTAPGLLAVARRSLAEDGVPVDALGVASGALDAQERIFQAWLRPGDSVAVEDPGWGSLFDLLPALGLKPQPMPVDDEGPTVEGLRAALAAGVRAVVVTVRAQNPTGAVVGAERASQLRAVLAEHPDVLLVEDDHGHGIVDQPYPALRAERDSEASIVRHWAVVRSVAKSLGPDLRVAVFAGDRETVDRVRGRQRLGAGWVSHLLQRTAAALWEGYDPVPTAASYRARREALLSGLARHGIAAHGRSGLYVWIPVADETSAVAGLLQRGWAVSPGARYRLHTSPGLRLTVSTLDLADCPRLVADVAAVLQRRASSTRGV
ncbi:aminotransferase class I/II-fold pyridoxal phosphate-dependent enzyme, partial [Streptacidiphilus anmyonensis]|uniref:aminotransferase class I/II-fold pyridoxal phosphate-dependent enzyme n=1 Tax=Streptacidiphilus anmyonensis TaxID=405782 RepID=UPI00069370C5